MSAKHIDIKGSRRAFLKAGAGWPQAQPSPPHRRKAAKGLIPNLPTCNRSAASC